MRQKTLTPFHALRFPTFDGIAHQLLKLDKYSVRFLRHACGTSSHMATIPPDNTADGRWTTAAHNNRELSVLLKLQMLRRMHLGRFGLSDPSHDVRTCVSACGAACPRANARQAVGQQVGAGLLSVDAPLVSHPRASSMVPRVRCSQPLPRQESGISSSEGSVCIRARARPTRLVNFRSM